ncbi:MAG: DUF6508 domain-containing protein [Anaerolineae bacterium]|jgi:hypothetical protein
MANHQITRERIDRLLRFLPRFDVPQRTYARWRGGEQTADGVITLPHPQYEEDVLDFFREAGQPWWSDWDYEPRAAWAMLQDDAFVAACSLAELKTMLTYCVRGERFSDGHWERMLQTGRVLALLRRLAVLRKELNPGDSPASP